jgi:hypothetical protein
MTSDKPNKTPLVDFGIPKQEKPYTVRLSRLCKGRTAPVGFQFVIVNTKSGSCSQLIKGTITYEQKEQLGEILFNQIIKGIK